MRVFFSSRLVFRNILIIKQGCDQRSDKVKTWGSGFYLLKKRREGRLECVWGTATAEDWPRDFFFLRVVTLV